MFNLFDGRVQLLVYKCIILVWLYVYYGHNKLFLNLLFFMLQYCQKKQLHASFIIFLDQNLQWSISRKILIVKSKMSDKSQSIILIVYYLCIYNITCVYHAVLYKGVWPTKWEISTCTPPEVGLSKWKVRGSSTPPSWQSNMAANSVNSY